MTASYWDQYEYMERNDRPNGFISQLSEITYGRMNAGKKLFD